MRSTSRFSSRAALVSVAAAMPTPHGALAVLAISGVALRRRRVP
jgi:MYXO-CTERM domain-containing protein